jgi:hypothetical protein
MAKAAFNKKRALCTGKMDLELRKKLVKCYIWSVALYGAETGTDWGVDRKQLDSVALYGAETGTVWGVDRKQLESFEMWCWRGMEKFYQLDRLCEK